MVTRSRTEPSRGGGRTREPHIETMRGLACLALVSFHVVGSTPQQGLELAASDGLVRLQLMLSDMRMPLFSFISGYVFTALAGPRKGWGQLARGKMRRLLVPLICVGTLFWLTGEAMGRGQMSWPETLVMPYAHFWFLQATFVLMMALLGLNWAVARAAPRYYARDPAAVSWRNAALIGTVGAGLYLSGRLGAVQLFSLPRAAYLAPFFMGGHIVALCLKPALAACSARGWLRIVMVLCLLGLTGWGAALAFHLAAPPEPQIRRALSVAIGLGAALSLLVLRVHSRFLAWIGDKSFTIYLFHVFFTAATTLALRGLVEGIDPHLVYPVSLAMGLAGPVALHGVILRSRWLRFACLGIGTPVPLRRVAGATP
ncbi:acyltransferase (plasmid) [Thioclava sp. 'Guangxiensis']|uniref:acyltransferase family protein n=1 Tax=Thioclava sp. 'Guangxiensis' TaxID=3149044 RepID=UPI003878387A